MKIGNILIILVVIFIIVYILNTKSCGASCETKKTIHTKMKTPTENILWSEFYEKAQEDNTLVIDIRTQTEILSGKLFDNALEIDYYKNNFEEEVSRLDPAQTYLIYCRSGGRSKDALNLFKKYGLKAYHLEGGYISAK